MDSFTKPVIIEKLEELKISYKSSESKADLWEKIPADVRAAMEKKAAEDAQAAADMQRREDALARVKELVPNDKAFVSESEALELQPLLDLVAKLEEDEAKKNESKDSGDGHKVANVFDYDGRFVRAYSSDIHGENFEALAKEFCDKNVHKVKPEMVYTYKISDKSAEPQPEEPAGPKKGETAVVSRKDGSAVREFTKEIHGEKFKDLADEFAAKNKLVVSIK